MNENEAIKMLEIQKPGYGCKEYQKPLMHAYEMAIKALEEVQQYRASGTVEELIRGKRYMNIAKHHGTIGQVIDECVAYEAIGTPEECRAAVEKQKAKKPYYEGDGYSDGHLVYDTWICPSCGQNYEVDFDNYDYCPNCGQKIRSE